MKPSAFDAANDLALSMPLDGMRAIEASAGTGKTYTIAGLYARFVVERKLPVRQILVMTFTKAATEELRARLRQRLALCVAWVTSPLIEPDAPWPQALDLEAEDCWVLALLRRARQAGDCVADLKQRLGVALQSMDEAAIFTIHGFCARVLAEHGARFDDVVPGAELVGSDLDLLRDFAADFWLCHADGNDPDALGALHLLAPDPDKLAETLRWLVPFAGEVEPVVDAMPALVDGEAAWKHLVEAWREGSEPAVAAFKRSYERGDLNGGSYRKGCVAALLDLAARLRDGGHPSVDELGKFGETKLCKAVNKNCPPFDTHPAFAAIDAWLAVDTAAAQRRYTLAAALLGRAVDEARAWLTKRKQALARLSHADQIGSVWHGLVHGDSAAPLRQALRAQYPCALIDEFQDTDARQFGIFETIFDGYGSLFVIGDPKQAIYAFRGGDVHAYLRAVTMARSKGCLKQNFRSTPALLDAVAAVFGREDAFKIPGIGFETVAPGGNVKDADWRIGTNPGPALSLWPLPTDEHDNPLNADDARAAAARGCAATIADLLAPGAATVQDEPLTPGRIAVLVNKNSEATLMLDALREVGVAGACTRRESVFATREARDLLVLLDALLTPQNLAMARGALAGDFLGRRLSDFKAMADDQAVARAALDELAALRECWLRCGVLAMIELLAERHATRLLALSDGERRMSNLMQLGDVLQAQARAQADERALRNWLAQRMLDADAGNEDEQLRLESDARRVQILTLHGSKGLEFDLVCLPFAASMRRKTIKRGERARFHRGDTLVERLILGNKETRAGVAADSVLAGEAKAVSAANDEADAELLRLLYVGMTRARYACWMTVGGKQQPGAPLSWLLGADPDYAALARQAGQQAIALVRLPDEPATRRRPRKPRPVPAARAFTRTLDRDWWRHSFSRLAQGHVEALPGAAADEAHELPDADANADIAPEVITRPRGTRFGSAVHAILEHADFAAWRDVDVAPRDERDSLQRQLRGAGYDGDELAAAQSATESLIAAALNAKITPRLRLADLPAAARRAELEFDFGMAGADPAQLLDLLHKHGYQRGRSHFARLHGSLRGLMNGIIDLVFHHDKQWWIVDYKTNDLGARRADYAPDRLPAAIAAHDYDLQYLIYTVALHRWLRCTLGDAYDYARDFGGVRYLFLRGMRAGSDAGEGVFADRPPVELIVALDAMLRAPGEVAA